MKNFVNKKILLKEASLLLIAVVLVLSAVAGAANTDIIDSNNPMSMGLDTFTEGFEDGVIPDGWLNFDNDSDGNLWEILQGPEFQPYSGEYSAGTTSLGGLYPDNWLVLPPLIISDTSELSYWLCIEDTGSHEDFEVFVSTTGNSVPDDFTDRLYGSTIPIPFWFDQTWDLSAYDGQTIYIAFRHTHPDVGEQMSWIKIDDINVTNVTIPASPELELVSIMGGIGLTVIARNIGDADATNINVSFEAEGGLFISAGEYEYPDTLAAGDSMEITFPVLGIGFGILTEIPSYTFSIEADDVETIEETVTGKLILTYISLK